MPEQHAGRPGADDGNLCSHAILPHDPILLTACFSTMDRPTKNLDKTHAADVTAPRSAPMRETNASAVPSFFLYGEPPQDVGNHFLHLENLDDRSRPNGWTIRPHAHALLSQIFFLESGGGEMRTERGRFGLTAPGFLLVPARLVHAFTWQPGTTGRVLTVATTYLQELLAADPALSGLFEEPSCLPLAPDSEATGFAAASLSRLARELAWRAPGQATAIEAQLKSLLVEVARLSHTAQAGAGQARSAQAELVARFREAIEAEFTRSHRLGAYTKTLGVSVTQLRAACRRVARQPPTMLIQDRIVIEAKRILIYTDATVSAAAYRLGFDDPAYFSRVFQKRTGLSPRAFRNRGIVRG
jgi:AraC family transcriptional activator of pobA